MYTNFKKDLGRGRKIENMILSNIQIKYPSAVLVDGKFSKYDIFIPENNYKIEVKYDLKSQETNNIVIELFMFNKPSALLATSAHLWVIYTGKEYLWIKPIKIFECIMLNNIQSREITGNGDLNTKKVCLVRLDLLKNYCYKVQTELKSEEII